MSSASTNPAIDPRMGQLEMIEPGLGMFHGFGNVSFAWGRGQILVVDTGTSQFGAMAAKTIRAASQEPIRYIVYTHGHGDHAFGTQPFLDDAAHRGDPKPEVWCHEAVAGRFERYRMTRGWQAHINELQFGVSIPREGLFSDRSFHMPNRTYRDRMELDLGGERVELRHAMGETDDCTWVWLGERRIAMVGDLIVSSMPNTGNPNKVQRYTLEWAEALEEIAALEPRYVLPGHGPVYGPELAGELLHETARALRIIHDEVLRRLNAGQWPIEIIEAEIRLPDDLATKSYLQPVYGCVPFVVRDVLRRYAGWWTGEPSQMFPASRRERGTDMLELCGRDSLVLRARQLAEEGQLKRALALAEIVVNGAPDDREAIDLNAGILEGLAKHERSFIARNFFTGAARQLRRRL